MPQHRPAILAVALMSAGLLLTSCDRTPADSAPQTNTFAQIYTVRGEVRDLPDPARPTSDFQVHHEAIPEFANVEGEPVGMNSMTMPFPTLAQGVSLDTLSVGDKIRLTFGVEWVQGVSGLYPRWTVTKIEPLPPETELHFGPANPAPTQSPTSEPTSPN